MMGSTEEFVDSASSQMRKSFNEDENSYSIRFLDSSSDSSPVSTIHNPSSFSDPYFHHSRVPTKKFPFHEYIVRRGSLKANSVLDVTNEEDVYKNRAGERLRFTSSFSKVNDGNYLSLPHRIEKTSCMHYFRQRSVMDFNCLKEQLELLTGNHQTSDYAENEVRVKVRKKRSRSSRSDSGSECRLTNGRSLSLMELDKRQLHTPIEDSMETMADSVQEQNKEAASSRRESNPSNSVAEDGLLSTFREICGLDAATVEMIQRDPGLQRILMRHIQEINDMTSKHKKEWSQLSFLIGEKGVATFLNFRATKDEEEEQQQTSPNHPPLNSDLEMNSYCSSTQQIQNTNSKTQDLSSSENPQNTDNNNENSNPIKLLATTQGRSLYSEDCKSPNLSQFQPSVTLLESPLETISIPCEYRANLSIPGCSYSSYQAPFYSYASQSTFPYCSSPQLDSNTRNIPFPNQHSTFSTQGLSPPHQNSGCFSPPKFNSPFNFPSFHPQISQSELIPFSTGYYYQPLYLPQSPVIPPSSAIHYSYNPYQSTSPYSLPLSLPMMSPQASSHAYVSNYPFVWL